MLAFSAWGLVVIIGQGREDGHWSRVGKCSRDAIELGHVTFVWQMVGCNHSKHFCSHTVFQALF